MQQISVRLPEKLHRMVRHICFEKSISVNNYIVGLIQADINGVDVKFIRKGKEDEDAGK